MNVNRLDTTCQDERGATAAEYALMVSLIAAVIIGVVTTLGSNVSDLFASVPLF